MHSVKLLHPKHCPSSRLHFPLLVMQPLFNKPKINSRFLHGHKLPAITAIGMQITSHDTNIRHFTRTNIGNKWFTLYNTLYHPLKSTSVFFFSVDREQAAKEHQRLMARLSRTKRASDDQSKYILTITTIQSIQLALRNSDKENRAWDHGFCEHLSQQED